MQTLNNKLNRIESELEEILRCGTPEPIKQPEEGLISIRERVFRERIETELATIKKHYFDGLEGMDSIFSILDYTVKYVESNVRKVASLIEVPVSSTLKAEVCKDFAREYIKESRLDYQMVDDLIHFLVEKNFPHILKKSKFGTLKKKEKEKKEK
jgi:hypothetical protein